MSVLSFGVFMSHLSCNVKYQAIFKNGVGSHCWVAIKQPKSAGKQEASLFAKCLHIMQRYYRSQKICDRSFASDVDSVKRELHSIRVLFWTLSKYSKYASQWDNVALADGVILNKNAIQTLIDNLLKDLKTPSKVFSRSPIKPLGFLALALSTIVPAGVLLIVIVMIKLVPNTMIRNSLQIKFSNSPRNFQVVTKWESMGHLFTNSSDYRSSIFYILYNRYGSISHLFDNSSYIWAICSHVSYAILLSLLRIQYAWHNYNQRVCRGVINL